MSGATRVLRVANESEQPFVGIAALSVDFRTRATPPVAVLAPDGAPVPSRLLNETLGPAAADGKRRWQFTLEFPASVPAHAVAEYVAAWGESSAPGEVDWSGPRLAAVEVEPPS